MQRILCVCLGNICRSPTAEVALRAALPSAQIDSAGTAGWHIGKPPYGPMTEAAARRGLDLTPLRARQLQPDDFHQFDLILGMDDENIANIEALRPEGGTADVALFHPNGVPDPYYTRDFEGALDLIEEAAQTWANQLQLR